ncbi:hypothetical protein [Janthinobacterium sp. GW458P]|uniref:hypothetical protein n=2 Tax=Janthinobacterium sp. GW458P TaxID=1981504 RepID=UPI000A3279EF|nr:hypothetical protein [Janthinobacterium sp. GW458P]MBE3024099.1 hypothetical protein [Janthinobacterium sp. GW458P]
MAFSASATARPSATHRVVGEGALRAMFAGHALSDGTHYTYQFQRDGSLTGAEMGRDVQGRWQVMAHSMCLSWIKPVGKRECYEVRMAGGEVQLSRSGREMYFGTLARLIAPA